MQYILNDILWKLKFCISKYAFFSLIAYKDTVFRLAATRIRYRVYIFYIDASYD